MSERFLETLSTFLQDSLTAYHARNNARALLLKNGFSPLSPTSDWELFEGGKYFVERGGSLIAFTVGGLEDFCYKLVASHVDSPALKLKPNPVMHAGVCAKLNVETYGGGVWYSFFDRPLKIAGQVVKSENGRVYAETVGSPFHVTIPSVAVHQNRSVNEGFSVNAQVDLLPLCALSQNFSETELLEKIAGEGEVISHDLFLVNADMPYSFGINDEFLASPRIDNLTSVCATLEALFAKADSCGVCVGAFFDHEEIGSRTTQGAAGDFLENTLKRIAYALRFDESEYYKALASSFLLSVDNAHASHPNHPEKGDPTNTCSLGKGVVIKSHAGKAYLTDGLSEGVIKTIFRKAGVAYQNFVNRSDVRSGSTLGVPAASALGLQGVDLGLAQLAMHSACESFAKSDYTELVNGLTAFYSTDVTFDDNGFLLR